ncbi:MAG TPA: DUF3105 domain-containing protein [Solirubrobacterales bacterium]|nr:DUF3105 domain-containing protein [Solirubrobacterales bacterium]
MANRREEERERLRQARLEREKKQAGSERRRLMVGYGVAGVIGVVVLVGLVLVIISAANENSGGEPHIDQRTGSTNGAQPDKRKGTEPAATKVTDLQEAARLADCDLRLKLRDEGHNHIPVTAPTPEYGTNPPTSGNHAESPYQQADGAYSEMPKEISLVHTLEHGRMEIQYSPDLSEADQLELIGLYETMWGGTVIFPNENMPYEVAATTWTNLLGCNEYKGSITLDAIRAFGKETWGKYGGEPVNTFDPTAPTPVEPTVN